MRAILKKIASRAAIGASVAGFCLGCACARHGVSSPPHRADKEPAQAVSTHPLAQKIAQFPAAVLTADLSTLPASERRALEIIIEAAKLLEPVFDRQAYAGNPELEKRLAADRSAEGRLVLTYFRMMRGPWDRQDEFRPFAIDRPHPAGAGLYPEDLTAEEFRRYVAEHPGDKEALESLFTVVKRRGDGLAAVPYSREYRPWLELAAQKLRQAAAASQNPSLTRFLRLRADAFLSDDYYESDKAWMDLDSRVEVTIGPYETYEDQLLALKASFEAFVTVSDPDASAKLAKYKALLPAMEENLPIRDQVKTVRGKESPIRVVDLVYTAGDARKSVQTMAFNLPNDERVRKEKGAKKVLLRNVIKTKFDRILRPIGERLLAPSQLPYLSADAFFHHVLLHELSHSLGPAFTTKQGTQVEVRLALESSYSAIEEAKADVMGAYNTFFLIERGEFPAAFANQLLASYFAGLFRSVRFGVDAAHGRGAALQINRFLAAGAVHYDDDSGRFTVDFAKLQAAIEALVHDICMVQHRGDKDAAMALLAEHGVMSPPIERALAALAGVPVDIRPIYPLAGERD